MRYHESDRGKRASELWRDACCLHHLLQINLERYPKGNVIRKAPVALTDCRSGDICASSVADISSESE